MTLPTITQNAAPRPPHDDRLAQAGLCSLCPKLCRPTCPVQNGTGRESAAPWRISDAVVRGVADGWTLPLAEQVAQCTGCGACGEPCLPGTNLPEESRAARAAAAEAGALLPAAERLRERIAATGSPRRVRRPARAGTRGGAGDLARGSGRAATVLLAGCPAPDEVEEAALALFAAAGEEVRTVDACCGAVAEDLGLAPEAAALRAGWDEAVGGADVVVASPSCARRLGAHTAVEWLAERLDRLAFEPVGGAVAWHAPCTLTRVLGVTEAPLRILAALGVEVREPAATGRRTRCSGAGAAYPLVDREGAEAVAAVRRAELAALGAPVVTACPSAARALDATELLVLAAGRLAR
ncbi:MAG TPA: heterodisulfide reductase-related iron-sulfur binding cluster [Frankiaceae bacterium]|nr:heterodisulfide reductase-related iron-sulfur binding cluster [Frankiaceae bacterium]